MDVRPATGSDRPAIREIARSSFTSSYSLSPEQIDTIVEAAFSDDALAARLDAADTEVLAAEEDGDVLGFADLEVGDEGVLRWLHVDPEARGRGVGTALLEAVQAACEDRSVRLTARLLRPATEGETFLERFGLEQGESVEVELAGEEFHEYVYAAGADSPAPNEPAVEVPETVDVDGERLAVDRDDPIPGTEAPFFPIHREGPDRPYGFFCSHCASTAIATDGLDRLQCNDCGNVHRPDEWDDAYL